MLLDLVMAKLDGIGASALQSLPRKPAVIVPPAADDERCSPPAVGRRWLSAKGVQPRELTEAIPESAKGNHSSLRRSRQVVRELQRREPRTAARRLTDRETQVLTEIARGRSNRRSPRPGIAEKTVKTTSATSCRS